MGNNTKPGQLLFPSTSHSDKRNLNKLEREREKREENKERGERER